MGVKMSSYWNRQICLACFTLVLMAAGFAAVYCGVKFGLTGENGKHLFSYFSINFFRECMTVEKNVFVKEKRMTFIYFFFLPHLL